MPFRAIPSVVLVVGAGISVWVLWWGSRTVGPLSGCGEGFNVLLITLDTTRADCLGCYGHPEIQTPHVDALAREGVRFAQCTATAPITLPSHASIMTATYPFVHRARNNGRYLADEGNVTLAEVLRDGGYTTGAEVGAYVLDAVWGINQGFDHYRSETTLEQRGERFERLASLESEKADAVCDRALEWLGEHGSEKFFLWVHFFDPHQPYEPPEPYRAEYRAPYLGEIAFTDEQIGRLLGEIRRMGLDDRTLVVLTADHGEGLGQHRELSHSYYVYDTTMRVPLIFRCPSWIPAGRVLGCQVRTVDIAPTILAFLGLEPKPDAQGVSLLPLVEGSTDDLKLMAYGESVYPHEAFGYARLWTCRADGWKYIHAPKPELYDVANDPGEQVNLANRDPDRVVAMRAELETVIAEGMEMGAAGNRAAHLDAVQAERLAALGYVGGYSPSEAKDELQLFQNFEGTDPKDHIEAHNKFLAAQALAMADQRERAVTLLHELIAEEPANPEYRNTLAMHLEQLEHLEQAAEQYANLLRLQPGNGRAQFRMGMVLGQLNRLTESLKHLRRAAELMPELPKTHTYLALGLSRQAEWEEAVQQFRQALELDPAYAEARVGLSEVLYGQRRYAEAVQILREGLERRPASVQLANNLAWSLATAPEAELRNGSEAVRVAEVLRERAGEGPNILDTLAAAYAEAGRFDEAVTVARRAVELAEKGNAAELADEIRARLALYESGQAYHEPP